MYLNSCTLFFVSVLERRHYSSYSADVFMTDSGLRVVDFSAARDEKNACSSFITLPPRRDYSSPTKSVCSCLNHASLFTNDLLFCLSAVIQFYAVTVKTMLHFPIPGSRNHWVIYSQ